MELSEHEKAYTPSQWSMRYGPMELLARYFQFCQSTTNEAKKTIKFEQDIPYGSSKGMKYDIYGTNLSKDAPIFMFIHGGYWQEFSKDQSGFVVANLVSNGIKVVIAGYDLCPKVRLTDIVAEIKTLSETVLKMAYNSSSKCVWIAGHSAGAHLAASLLHDKQWLDSMSRHGYLDLLKGLFLISGIYSLEALLHTSFNDALKLTSEEVKDFSFAPINNEKDLVETLQPIQDLKVVILVGEFDSPAFIEESKRYAQKLIAFVDSVEFLLLRGIDHFDIVENLTNRDFVFSKLIVRSMNE